MKKLVLPLLFIFSIPLFAQQNNEIEINQYLKKSNSKRKTGNVLLITGGGLILTGIIVGSTGTKSASNLITDTNIAGIGISGLGVLSVLTSVPFYISAASNKRKSLKLTPSASIVRSDSMADQQNYLVINLKLSF